MHIVGTPRKTWTFSRANRSRAAFASNRSTRATDAPAASVMFSAADMPKTCASGAPPNTTSSCVTASSLPSVVATMRSPVWVSSAPFGPPVVPDV